MNLSKMTAAVALAAAASFGGSAMAASITNTDGVLQPFAGFDWAGASAAWTTGLVAAESFVNPGTGACAGTVANPTGCSFSIEYAGWAVALNKTGGGTLAAFTPNLDSDPNGTDQGYEYTMRATLQATLLLYVPGFGAQYTITGGSFTIYYDTAANAQTLAPSGGAWTGFNDGTAIVQGTLTTAAPQLFNLASGSGNIDLVGTVTTTNGAYINPAIVGTQVSSTLQLYPTATTEFSPPTSVDGTPVDAVAEALFQADANQSFTFSRVPEPASMLLAGLALVGAGVASRRRKA